MLEILYEKKLHCSDWRKMNDLMEGWALPSASTVVNVYKDVLAEQEKLKVCSLSKTCKSHLLWAHYANGFDGVAIEVTITRSDAKEVKCLPNINTDFPLDISPDLIARERLCRKYECWKYEEEMRIIQRDEKYPVIEVSALVVGSRVRPPLYKALYTVCENQGIPVYTTCFSATTIEVERVDGSPSPIN